MLGEVSLTQPHLFLSCLEPVWVIDPRSRCPATPAESYAYGFGMPNTTEPSGFRISTAPVSVTTGTAPSPSTTSQNDQAAAPVSPGAADTMIDSLIEPSVSSYVTSEPAAAFAYVIVSDEPPAGFFPFFGPTPFGASTGVTDTLTPFEVAATAPRGCILPEHRLQRVVLRLRRRRHIRTRDRSLRRTRRVRCGRRRQSEINRGIAAIRLRSIHRLQLLDRGLRPVRIVVHVVHQRPVTDRRLRRIETTRVLRHHRFVLDRHHRFRRRIPHIPHRTRIKSRRRPAAIRQRRHVRRIDRLRICRGRRRRGSRHYHLHHTDTHGQRQNENDKTTQSDNELPHSQPHFRVTAVSLRRLRVIVRPPSTRCREEGSRARPGRLSQIDRSATGFHHRIVNDRPGSH